ncbi:hypothetical protein [Cyanobium sp. Morenito 9A2]|uniref:hypothetical protein n=1 Tax=Cyanobium sp. Morenito 9A2 TaxID=2823718 RepID=UPI0020CBF28C|nr:hypothetical protein [Cyanobium sp. Morenito 9A2]MCP9850431.1 hypothetical protein [Cyanobium sp. Morenito 9A2]
MHPETLAALKQLAGALQRHPEDVAELAMASDLPDQLGRLIEDYFDPDAHDYEE